MTIEAKNQSLFPFNISEFAAMRLAEKDGAFASRIERETKFSNVRELIVSGKVFADMTLQLNAWISTDNGFCQTAGRCWERSITLTKEQFERFVDDEITSLAIKEIQDEENKKLQLRINARALELRAKLLNS